MNRINLLYFLLFFLLLCITLTRYFALFSLDDLRLFLPPSWCFLFSGILPHRSVIVAVATRPDRMEYRRAIRNTWKALAPPGQVEVIFFSPETLCQIDPYWRIRESSCSMWNIFMPANVNDRMSLRPYRVQPSLLQAGPPADGVGFKLKFPISITQLGISVKAFKHWSSSLPPESASLVYNGSNRHDFPNVTVQLWDPAKDEVLVAANISSVEFKTNQADDGFVYVEVQDDIYPRNFDGVIRVWPPVINATIDLACNIIWNKMFGDDGIISLTSLWESGKSFPFSPQSCPLVSLVYQIPDVTELRQVVNAKFTQNKCQENKNGNLEFKLVEESEDFGDILFIPDVVDVSENIPKALLAFFTWSLSHFDFDLMLVTNDETFVAADQLPSKLEFMQSDYTWISNFEKFSPVFHYGYQYEPYYSSSHYPEKPAISGSLLSRGLVAYLSRTAEFLLPFRTVSSSLAIWLAPLNSDKVYDLDWSLNNRTCSKSTIALGPIHDSKVMKKIQRNYKQCNMLCSCMRNNGTNRY